MPKFLEHLHYRVVDVSTVKELCRCILCNQPYLRGADSLCCRRWYPADSAKVVKKNSHRALDDIKESIEELKFYKQSIFKQP